MRSRATAATARGDNVDAEAGLPAAGDLEDVVLLSEPSMLLPKRRVTIRVVDVLHPFLFRSLQKRPTDTVFPVVAFSVRRDAPR
jgi:hypothetical protein